MTNFEGLVIGSFEYKEKSKIVELYTPFGKENILAKGASKVQSKSLLFGMTLNHVLYEKSKSSLPVMIDFEIKKSYYNLIESLDKAQVIMVIVQVIKSISDDINHQKVFNFLIKCLDLLENNNSLYVLSVFLIKMLVIYGVQPSFKKCAICGKEEIVNFSLKDGGGLCGDCSNLNNSNLKLINELKFLYYDKSYIDPNYNYEELLKIIYSYYSIHVNMKLKPYKITL